MVGTLQPLDQKFAIVDEQGRPTRYFIQWAQQKQIDISNSITSDGVVMSTDLSKTGWGDAGYVIAETVSVGNPDTQGDIILIQGFNSGGIDFCGSMEFDIKGFVGGANIGPQHSVTNRLLLSTYGSIVGWQFNNTPFVNNFRIYHEGILSFGTGLSYDALTGVLSAAGGGGGNVLEIPVTKPVAANFTLVGGGAGISFADGAFGPVVRRDGTTGGAVSLVTYNVAPGAASFTLTARLRAPNPQYGAGYSACLILRNSSNGRFLIWGNFSNDNNQILQSWSSPTVVVATIFNLASNAFSNWPWRRIVLSAGVLTFFASVDGDIWEPIQTTTTVAAFLTAAGGALDQVGFGSYNARSGTLCQSWTLV